MKRLRYRLGLSYGLLVAITIAISIFAAYHFTRLNRSIETMLFESYSSVLAAENMVKALEIQERSQYEMREPGRKEQARREFDLNRDAFWKAYDQAVSGTTLPQEPAILDSIRISYQKYLKASDVLHGLVVEEQYEEAAEYHTDDVRPLARRLRFHNFRLMEVNQRQMAEMRRQVNVIADNATKTLILACVAAVIFSILVVLRNARRIVGPIDRLTSGVRLIAQGQLNQRIEVTTDDEIAELSREFNKMSERLQAFEAINVQQLIAEKKKSESLVATMPNPVIVTDAEDHVLLLNEAATDMLDVRGRNWENQNLSEVIRDVRLARKLLNPPVEEEQEPLFEYRRNGETHYYRKRQTAICDVDGSVALKVVLLEDVTWFKELDQLKSDFLAAVSHELRTPLTSLGMALDILLQEVLGKLSYEQKELLEAAHEDNERLKRLVKSLLDLARLESGTYTSVFEPVEFSHVVLEALGPLHLPFREKGVDLVYRVDPDLPIIQGDSQQLGWAITNLVGNALRYTPPGGKVSVNASRHNGHIEVSVADTGRGIPGGDVSRIFDKFVQIKSSGESTPGSVGLGLAIAKQVVETHGGKIWAESEQGKGSTFHFYIPVSTEPADGSQEGQGARR